MEMQHGQARQAVEDARRQGCGSKIIVLQEQEFEPREIAENSLRKACETITLEIQDLHHHSREDAGSQALDSFVIKIQPGPFRFA